MRGKYLGLALSTLLAAVLFAFHTAPVSATPVSLAQSVVSIQPENVFVAVQENPVPKASDLESGALKFSPLSRETIDFGYSSKTHWLRFELANPGSEPVTRIVVLEARFMHRLLALETSQGGQTRKMLEDSQYRPFDERAIPYRYLAFEAVLDGKETRRYDIGYWSDGGTAMPITVLSPSAFLARQEREKLTHAIYFAVGFMFILFAVLSIGPQRPTVQLAYIYYLASALLYIAHMRGYAFQYLWPEASQFNADASLAFGYNLGIAGLLFMRQFLRLDIHARLLERITLAFIAFGLIAIVFGFTVEAVQTLKQSGFVFVFLSGGFQLGCAFWARWRGVPGATFLILGWLNLLAAAVMGAGVAWIGFGSAVGFYDYLAWAILVEAIMFILAINRQVSEMQKERAAALTDKLAVTQENLRLSEERNEALTEAERRRSQLAAASHDAMQPLAALRMTLAISGMKSAESRRVGEMLDQIQILFGDNLRETRPVRQSTNIRTGPILQRLETLHNAEARSRGVDLRVVERDLEIKAAEAPITRILGNLIHNAIVHADAEAILVGLRSSGGRVQFLVVDNGKGMDTAMLGRAFSSYEKGEDSQGTGLGLPIAAGLASECGFDLSVRSKPGRGTAFSLTVPAQR